MSVLEGVRHQEVFRYFEEISAIPRGSCNEKAISDYMMAFAEKHQLEAYRDQALNVIIKKSATEGYEKAPTVILQGHLDMVCEKNRGTQHDFEKDPIRLKIVGDMMYAHDTTLGADNGIAIAYALALLAAKEIPHPALEVLMTTDEETSMSGAINLEASPLQGRMLINLDSEEEGKLLVSSAGGRKAKVVLPVLWEAAPEGKAAYFLRISGLKGGHSGMEIDKGRGNANRLMGRLLNGLCGEFKLQLAEINGGMKSNAIPRECEALVLLDQNSTSGLQEKLAEWNSVFANELRASDGGVQISLEPAAKAVPRVFSGNTMNRIISALVMLPNGIQSMSMDIRDLVESSTNMGVVSTKADEVWIYNEIRSSVFSLKAAIYDQVAVTASVLSGSVVIESEYPGWAYDPNSRLRTLFSRVYEEMYGKKAEIIAIHAGLECGVFMEKMQGLDAISLGPNLYDVHTPEEHFSISSAERTWEFLLETLKKMKEL